MNLYFIHAGICVNIAGNLHAVYVGSRGVGKRAFERIEHTGGLKTGIAVQNIKTEIIAASVRNPIHVTAAARAGCNIATVPMNVIRQMIKHPLTDAGIERFLKDWDGLSVR